MHPDSRTPHRPHPPAASAARRFALPVVLALGLTHAAGANAAPLDVSVDDVRSADGTLMVQVYDVAAGEDHAVAQLLLDPTPPSVRFSVDLAPGAYGMRVMHDLDGDGEMDTNLVGIPTEPWAFSNNATGRFGPPAPEDVRFVMTTAPAVQTLRLVH